MFKRLELFLKKHINFSWKYVGSDLSGNLYFQSKDRIGSYFKRKVETGYSKPFKYNSDSDLPVQWRSWLSHTRQDAPTIQELEEAQEAFDKLQVKISLLESKKQMLASKHSAQGKEFVPESWKPGTKSING